MKVPTIDDRIIPWLVVGWCVLMVLGLRLAWLDGVENSGVRADAMAQDSIVSLQSARIASEATRDSLAAVLDSVEGHRQAELASALTREAEADGRAVLAATRAQRLFSSLRETIDSAGQVLADSLEVEHHNEVVALREQIVSRDTRIVRLETSFAASTALHIQRDTIEASLRAEIVQHGEANVGLRSALAASNAARSMERKIGFGTAVVVVAVVVLR